MRTILIGILLTCLGITSNPISSYGQIQGSWSIGWSFGFVSKGGGFVKYYPMDGVAIEVFAGGYPHIWHLGSELSIHPLMLTSNGYKNFAFTAGYSWFGGTLSSNQGINLGAELSFTTKQSQLFSKDALKEDGMNENFFLSIGTTYIIKSKSTKFNENNNSEAEMKVNESKFTWTPYLEGGVIYFDNR